MPRSINVSRPRSSRLAVGALCVLATGGALVLPAASSATADDAPAAVQGIQVTFEHWQKGQDQVSVTWDAPAQPVDSYRLVYTPASTADAYVGSGTAIDTVDGSATSDEVLLPAGNGPGRLWVFALAGSPSIASPGNYAGTGWRESPALQVQPVNGVAHEVSLSVGGGFSSDDHLALRQVTDSSLVGPTQGIDVPLPADLDQALELSTGTGQQTPTYALYEVSNADPDQWAAPTYINGTAAPLAEQLMPGGLGLFQDTDGDPSTLTVNWFPPVGCPLNMITIRRCSFARAVIKEGTTAPASPWDGDQILPSDSTYSQNVGTTFSGLTVGHTYSVSVFNMNDSGPLKDAYSPPLSGTFVDTAPTTLRWDDTVSRTIIYGTTVTVRGEQSLAFNGAPAPGSKVTLRRIAKGIVTAVVSGNTDQFGDVKLAYRPSATYDYELQSTPTDSYGMAETGDLIIHVRPVISVGASHTSLRVNQRLYLSGTVAPKVAGRLYIQRYSDGAWHNVATTNATTSGRYAGSVKVSSTGKWSYRVYRSATSTLSSGVTRTEHITVH